MKYLTKTTTKKTFNQNGIRMNPASYELLDKTIEAMLTAIAQHENNTLTQWDNNKERAYHISKPEALQEAINRYHQSQIAPLTEKLIQKLCATLEKEGTEIANQYSNRQQSIMP